MRPRPPDDARPSRPRDQGPPASPSDAEAGGAVDDDLEWVADEVEPGQEGPAGDAPAAGVEVRGEEGAAAADAPMAGETVPGEEGATGDGPAPDETVRGRDPTTGGAPPDAAPGGWVVPDDEDPVDPAVIAASLAASDAREARKTRPDPTEAVLVPGVSDDAERTALLIEFLRDQERRSQRWARKPRRRTPPATTLGAAVLVVISMWLWLLPPGWAQPNLPPPVPVELQEAGLRLGMYLQAQQIEAFRRQRGRLPDALHETGEPIPGMYYRRLNAREYRLHGVTPRLALTYLSTDSLNVFLSDAHRVVGFGSGR